MPVRKREYEKDPLAGFWGAGRREGFDNVAGAKECGRSLIVDHLDREHQHLPDSTLIARGADWSDRVQCSLLDLLPPWRKISRFQGYDPVRSPTYIWGPATIE
jgi:hypothetical protein